MKEQARLSQAVCKRFIEVLSRGNITLSFTEITLSSTLTDLISYQSSDSGAAVVTVHADIESIEPYPGELVLESCNTYDTFLFYWAGDTLREGENGRATAMFTEPKMPIIPYVMAGPSRGIIVMSSVLADRPGSLLHEMFHDVEHCYDITPCHGFRDNLRVNFPQWTGSGEYNYYQYQFDTTVAAAGYEQFKFSELNRYTEDDYYSLLDEIKNIPLYDRKAADLLYDEAMLIYNTDRDKAEQLLKNVISENPFHADALCRLCSISHYAGNKDEAFNYINRAYLISPYDPYICYWMGVEYYHKGMYEESVSCFSEAVSYLPSYAAVWQYMGFVNYQLGNYDETLYDYTMCMELTDEFDEFIKNYLSGRVEHGDEAAGTILNQLGL